MDTIPFTPSDNNDTIGTAFDNTKYWFVHHWNWRDGAHYFDMYEEDFTSIAVGVKVVLGVNLARYSTHPFFQSNILRAIDTSGQGLDAGFDELGARVVVLRTPVSELGAP